MKMNGASASFPEQWVHHEIRRHHYRRQLCRPFRRPAAWSRQKNILLVDAGERRNRFASHSHGFLGQDGKAPGEIIAEARRQIERYPTIHWVEGRVTDAKGSFGEFIVEIDGGRRETAGRLILAMGVTDELPEIAGLRALGFCGLSLPLLPWL